MNKKELPKIIESVGFDFNWDNKKVWSLKVPVEEMSVDELSWHFDIPFWDKPRGYYDLTPNQVLSDPSTYKEEYERIKNADMSHPLDIMFWKNHWLMKERLMDSILVKSAFIAVFDKKNLDSLVPVLKNLKVKVMGTEGTVKYLKAKGIVAKSVVSGFDFDGRVKSLDRKNFAAILADSSKKNHLSQLAKLQVRPVNAVIVDLYKPDKKGFPESMDIGGQALMRAAVKNYKFVSVAFDAKSIDDLAWELKTNKGQTNLAFRQKQAARALKFIAQRATLEAKLF